MFLIPYPGLDEAEEAALADQDGKSVLQEALEKFKASYAEKLDVTHLVKAIDIKYKELPGVNIATGLNGVPNPIGTPHSIVVNGFTASTNHHGAYQQSNHSWRHSGPPGVNIRTD